MSRKLILASLVGSTFLFGATAALAQDVAKPADASGPSRPRAEVKAETKDANKAGAMPSNSEEQYKKGAPKSNATKEERRAARKARAAAKTAQKEGRDQKSADPTSAK